MICKICNNPSKKIFEKKILQKYNTNYYKCISCSFIQTDEPIWYHEAYQSAITSLDIGLPNRNILLKQEIKKIIDCCFPESKIYIDFAGGYGLFVRFMRDMGFDFYRQDDYCENLFAKHFNIEDAKTNKFDIITAFEVFEHFKNPIEEIEKMFNYSDTIILSTELTPDTNKDIENWWYIAPDTGQHIAFYSTESMKFIAQKYNKNFYSKYNNIHVFTSKKLNQKQVDFAFNDKKVTTDKKYFWKKPKEINYSIERQSLLEIDFNFIKSLLNSTTQK